MVQGQFLSSKYILTKTEGTIKAPVLEMIENILLILTMNDY